MSNILAIIQARMTSQRLPGKVLMTILEKPMLLHQVERVRRSQLIDEIVVATSRESSDDLVFQACSDHEVSIYRGSLDDVLDRFYQLALTKNPKHVVRITADCPLIDSKIIDQVVDLHIRGNYDYTSNVYPHSFPDGLDVEIMRFETLKTVWKEASSKEDREHVTSFIVAHPHQFQIGRLENSQNLSTLRWTVDNLDDFKFVERVYSKLYPKNKNFNMQDILKAIETDPQLNRGK